MSCIVHDIENQAQTIPNYTFHIVEGLHASEDTWVVHIRQCACKRMLKCCLSHFNFTILPLKSVPSGVNHNKSWHNWVNHYNHTSHKFTINLLSYTKDEIYGSSYCSCWPWPCWHWAHLDRKIWSSVMFQTCSNTCISYYRNNEPVSHHVDRDAQLELSP